VISVWSLSEAICGWETEGADRNVDDEGLEEGDAEKNCD
jgi:hypothetical protein